MLQRGTNYDMQVDPCGETQGSPPFASRCDQLPKANASISRTMCSAKSSLYASYRISLPSITFMAAAALQLFVVARAHDIASVQNINNDTISAQSLPPIGSGLMPSLCTVTSDCYSLDPPSRCIATINDALQGSSSYVTLCSLCSSRYRFGAAPRVCAPSTATCTCAAASTVSSTDPSAVFEFSVGLRPHLATLVATSIMGDGSRTIACEWQFQTLLGDEQSECQQHQQQLLLRGFSSSTRLSIQTSIDTAALVSLFTNQHPRVLMLMEQDLDDSSAPQGDGKFLPSELCLMLLNTATSSCVSLNLPVISNPLEFFTATVVFDFSVHWMQLHGLIAQLELVSAGSHTFLLGTSHVIILNVPDAINRSEYISQFSNAPSLHHRAVLKSSLVDRLPTPVGDARFLFPLPPIKTLGDFQVEGLLLPTRRAVAMCIVGETRNFFEDGALTAQLIRDNIGSAVSCCQLWRVFIFIFIQSCRSALLTTF
jgi:hypothetical protein